MADRPILFSGPMVRALLADTKTQTRRVFKLPTKGIYEHPDMGGWAPTINGGGGSFTIGRGGSRVAAPETAGIWHQTTGRCLNAPIQVGDRLWVREAWRTEIRNDDIAPRDLRAGVAIYYESGGGGEEAVPECAGRFRQGMHMPRWASRITLTVTDVRVQRLQDISREDAVAEGLIRLKASGRYVVKQGDQHFGGADHDPRAIYSNLWNSLNADRGFGWETNPWVLALSFAVERRNIDEAA